MTIEAESLYAILSGNGPIEEKTAAVASLKADVKRTYVDLNSVRRYFEALKLSIENEGPYSNMLQPIAFSSMCHLIKRVILQDSETLKGSADVVLPLLVNKFSDSKTALRTTAKRVFEDYWIACPNEAELIIRNVGFVHNDETIRLESIQMLNDRISIQEKRFVFRPFTNSVVALLNDSSELVRKASYDLLVSFFRNAHVNAKKDLGRELTSQGVNGGLRARILREIGFEGGVGERPSSRSGSRMANTINTSSNITSSTVNRSRPVATNVTPNTSSSPSSSLSINFITDQEGYKMDALPAEDISSPDTLRFIIEEMSPAFEGKETEFNWIKREKNILRLRSIIRGNALTDFPDIFVWVFKSFSDAIVKSISSLRTSLSTHGCQLVKDGSMILKHLFDPVIEPYLSNLIKLTQGAKKISAQIAGMVINALIINTSYSPKYVNHIQLVVNDKAPQAKVLAAGWIRLLIACHSTKPNSKHHIESTGGDLLIEKCISKGLVDANPLVRENMRLAFWDFYSIFTKQGESSLNKLDTTTRKALERVKPQGVMNSNHAPLKITRAATAGSRPGIRDFIVKSREKGPVSKEPIIIVPSKPSKLRNVAGNSGLRKHGAGNVDKGLEVMNVPTITPPPIQEQTGSTIGITGDNHITSVRSPTIIPPSPPPLESVSDLLQSNNDSSFINGMYALNSLLRGKEPSSDVRCRLPATLPTPDIIESSLKKVFSFDNNETVTFKYPDLVKCFCDSDLIGSVLQFVGTKDTLYGVCYSLEDTELQNSLKSLNYLLITSEAFIVLVDLLYDTKKVVITELLRSVGEKLDTNAKIEVSVEKLKTIEFERERIEDILTVLKGKGLVEEEKEKIEEKEKEKVEENEGEKEKEEEEQREEEKEDKKDIVNKVHNDGVEIEDVEMQMEAESSMYVEMDDEFTSPEDEHSEEAVAIHEIVDKVDVISEIDVDTRVDDNSESILPDLSLEITAVNEIIPVSEDVEMNEAEGEVQGEGEEDNSTNLNLIMEPVHQPIVSEPLDEPIEEVTVETYLGDRMDDQLKENTAEEINNHDEDIGEELNKVEVVQGFVLNVVEETKVLSNDQQKSNIQPQEAPLAKAQAEEEEEEEGEEQYREKPQLTVQSSFQHQEQMVLSPSPQKLSIFEDSDPYNTPHKYVQTPIRLRENINSIIPWHSLPSNKNVCQSPLPQTDEDASQLYNSLINQMNSKSIDSHGFRKLITIVKGAKNETSVPIATAYVTWKKGKWLIQLQKSILNYLSFKKELTENEISQALLLTYQLLEIEPTSFDGYEIELFKLFSFISGTSNSTIIGLGALSDTTKLLIGKCNRDGKDCINLRVKMIEEIVEIYDSITSDDKSISLGIINLNETILFLISSLTELISSSINKQGLDNELTEKLPAISSIIISNINNNESRIRKQTYPLLVTLFTNNKQNPLLDDLIINKMSIGQKQLFEFFCDSKCQT